MSHTDTTENTEEEPNSAMMLLKHKPDKPLPFSSAELTIFGLPSLYESANSRQSEQTTDGRGAHASEENDRR